MKVLHVLDHSLPIISGYSLRSRWIVTYQARLGLSPIIVTSPKHGPAPAEIETIDGLRYHRTGSLGSQRSFVDELRLVLRLGTRIGAIVTRERPRVIHAHSPSLNGLAALAVGRRLGVPVVYEARAFWEDAAVDHGTTRPGSLRYRLTRALESLVFRHADAVVTICEGMRRDILARGVEGSRVTAVPNGVDVDWFQPRPPSDELRHGLGLDGGIVFGFVGSFYRYEGLRFLVRGFDALRQRTNGKVRLLLVGAGDEAAILRSDAAAQGDVVVFTGPVAPDRIRDYYAAMDVFVCPRHRMRLTELVTPLKPLEAMAMARTVLASDVGGLRELVEDGVSGALFPAESVEGFVHAAIPLARDAVLRDTLGRAARRRVVRERRWEDIVARYPAIYRAAGA